MKLFLSIAAVLAWAFGAALLFVPDRFYAPMHMAMTPLVATVAQAHGATLIGVGVIDWLGRNAERQGQIAILAGNLLAQIASLAVVLRTMTLGVGAALAPGVIIHVSLGLAFGSFLLRTARAHLARQASQ